MLVVSAVAAVQVHAGCTANEQTCYVDYGGPNGSVRIPFTLFNCRSRESPQRTSIIRSATSKLIWQGGVALKTVPCTCQKLTYQL